MAHIVVENGKISVARNARDLGIFDGDNMSNINEAETIKVISETPNVAVGIYANDIIVTNDTTAQLNETDEKMFSKIVSHARVIGAKFIPLIVSAEVEKEKVNYEIFATYKNNSGFKFPTILKVYETTPEGKKQEIDLASKRAFFNDLKNIIADTFMKAVSEQNTRPTMVQEIVSLFTTHPQTQEKTDSGVLPKIAPETLGVMLPTFRNIITQNKDLFPEGDIAISNINKFMNNQNINLIMMNLQHIVDNRQDKLKGLFGINIKATIIEEYQIDTTTLKDSVTFKYSSLKNALNENAGEVFKNSYIKDDIRNDKQKFFEFAQKDPYAAYHFLNDLKREIAPEYSEYVALSIKGKGGSLSDSDRQKKESLSVAINNKLSVLKNPIPSIDFKGGANLMDKFGAENPTGILSFLASKIKTKLANIQDLDKLRLTKDGDRVIRDSNGRSIWYDTTLSSGLCVVDFSKDFYLKGTMSNDIRLKPSISPVSIVIPTKTYVDKNNNLIETPLKVLFPKNTNTIDKKMLEILNKINKMNSDGTIGTSPANISKDIDFLVSLLKRENIGIESKRYQKTKGVLTEIIGFLANNKDNIVELKNMVNGILDGTGFKIGPKKTFKDPSTLSALKAAIICNKDADLWRKANNNTIGYNKAIISAIVANMGDDPQSLKDKKLDKYTYIAVHKMANEIISMNEGWSNIRYYIEDIKNEKVKQELYGVYSNTPQNPLTSNPVVTTAQGNSFIAGQGMGGNFVLDDNTAMSIKTVKEDGTQGNDLFIPIPSKIASTINAALKNDGKSELKFAFKQGYDDRMDDLIDTYKRNMEERDSNKKMQGFALNSELMAKIQAGNTGQVMTAPAPQQNIPAAQQPQVQQPQKRVEEVSVRSQTFEEEQQIFTQEAGFEFDDYDYGATMDSNPYMDEPDDFDDESQYTYNQNQQGSLFDNDDNDIDDRPQNRPNVKI